MNPISRVLRYLSARTGLEGLHRERMACVYDSQKPLCTTFGYSRGLLLVNSHSSSTFDQVKALFAGKPIDLLFIDGDHTYDGVKHWEYVYHPQRFYGVGLVEI